MKSPHISYRLPYRYYDPAKKVAINEDMSVSHLCKLLDINKLEKFKPVVLPRNERMLFLNNIYQLITKISTLHDPVTTISDNLNQLVKMYHEETNSGTPPSVYQIITAVHDPQILRVKKSLDNLDDEATVLWKILELN